MGETVSVSQSILPRKFPHRGTTRNWQVRGGGARGVEQKYEKGGGKPRTASKPDVGRTRESVRKREKKAKRRGRIQKESWFRPCDRITGGERRNAMRSRKKGEGKKLVGKEDKVVSISKWKPKSARLLPAYGKGRVH